MGAPRSETVLDWHEIAATVRIDEGKTRGQKASLGAYCIILVFRMVTSLPPRIKDISQNIPVIQ